MLLWCESVSIKGRNQNQVVFEGSHLEFGRFANIDGCWQGNCACCRDPPVTVCSNPMTAHGPCILSATSTLIGTAADLMLEGTHTY